MDTFFVISNILLWLALAFVAFLLLGALRSLSLLSWRIVQLEATTPSRIGRNGLQPGKRAPNFTLPSVAGGELSLGDFAGQSVLLVFVQAGCRPCHEIAPELNRIVVRNPELQVLVINNADLEQAREYAREVNAQFPVLVQERWSASKRYEVFATPFAFLIDEQRLVTAKGIVSSKEHLRYLFSAATSPAAVSGPAVDDPVYEERDGSEGGTLGESVSVSPKEVQHV